MKTTEDYSDEIIRKKLIGCSEEQIGLLKKYLFLLLEWNQKINLISRADTANAWSKHIINSLSLLFRWKLNGNSLVVDIGTGGGLPGIPIAIMEPSIEFLLIDSTVKKCKAVDDIVGKLSLKNVKVLSARAEEIAGKKEFIHSFDYVLARAVAPIEDLLKWSGPFLKRKENNAKQADQANNGRETIPAGSFIFWKGGDISQEIEKAKLKYKLHNISVFPLTQEDGTTADNPDKKIIIITQ